MAKTVSKAKQAEKIAKELQLLVRMKAADESGFVQCVTCGVIKHYTEMDGGHYISRKYSATKLLEENIHPQCKGCNGFKNGNMDAYALFMIDTYGREFLEELDRLKNSSFKWVKAELDELSENVKRQLVEQKSRLGV